MRESSRSNRDDYPLPGWIGALAVGFAMLALLLLERRFPLRRATESANRRDARNFAMAGLAAASVRLAETPITTPLTHLVQRRNLGLLKLVRMPRWLEVTLACLLLDYTLYLWHILTHQVPFLWRFHRVHHADLDLSTTTALRFHFGEMTLSVGYRAAQVLLIGVSPLALSIWGTLLLVEIMFHHSNVELPPEIERKLHLLIVTPRMHGIHHSIISDEVNSNWSSGLTLWDYLHGTLRLGIPQDQISIGVPELRRPEQVTLPKIVVMPFVQAGQTPAGITRDISSVAAEPPRRRTTSSSHAQAP